MDLDSIMDPSDAGEIRTANTVDSRVMDTPPVSQIRRSSRPRTEQSPGTGRHRQQRISPAKQQRKRPSDKHRVRGGAKYNTLHNVSPALMDATSSRHQRHHKPSTLADEQPATATPKPSSPAKDMLRRAQQSAAVDAESLGRRPFIMDLILGGQPVVSHYSEDVIMEAIELSRAALRPAAGTCTSADELSLDLRGECQAGEFSTAPSGTSPPSMNAAYQVSAERTTAAWPRDEPCLPEMSPSNYMSSPSVRLGYAAAHVERG
ncbi:hypothetical protein BN946_scf185015.g94 [Trametes cinnabarina]|uniref:Uncharacterized protein n=1 Tax=Pycnoporus cinnabarinus TaxID=5643 RepID=A0A060SHW1_PYCCI|nr:hypothetical protein BN946_scf185015.g94 [Trametes cinnabarina]